MATPPASPPMMTPRRSEAGETTSHTRHTDHHPRTQTRVALIAKACTPPNKGADDATTSTMATTVR